MLYVVFAPFIACCDEVVHAHTCAHFSEKTELFNGLPKQESTLFFSGQEADNSSNYSRLTELIKILRDPEKGSAVATGASALPELMRANASSSADQLEAEIHKVSMGSAGRELLGERPLISEAYDYVKEWAETHPLMDEWLGKVAEVLVDLTKRAPVLGNIKPPNPTKTEETEYVKSNRWFVPKRFSLRAIEREGIGYHKGYSTAELLLAPASLQGDFIPMIDLRAHHLYNDTYAANLGVIARKVYDKTCRIFGVNGYYDFRQGRYGNYQRLGLGMELLGKRWDFRVNGYLGIQENELKCVFDQYTGGYVATFRKDEFSFQGFNGEAGFMAVKSNNFLLYMAAGPYYLQGKHDMQSWGGRFRFRPQFRDYLALEFSMSHDHIFQTRYQGEIILNLPLYDFFFKKNKKKRKCVSDRQIYQPVERFEIIPLKRRCLGWETNF